MAQLVFIVVLLAGGWLLYKRFVGAAEKLSARRRERERESRTGAIGTLVRDPETGEYRLRREDD